MNRQGKPQDINVVEGNLDSHKRYLTVADINNDYSGTGLPVSITKKALLEAVKNGGYWVTNGASSGAFLAITLDGYNTVPVLNSRGQKIEYSYEDLTDPKHKLPANMNVIPKNYAPLQSEIVNSL